MSLWRFMGLSAAVSGHLRRGLSTSASHRPWAMLYRAKVSDSPARRASFELTEPPCPSHLVVPAHLIDLDPDSGPVMSTSGDGLVLLEFIDFARKANVVARHRSAPTRELPGGFRGPDVTRFICNPISGQLFRLPDIDGTKKSLSWSKMGILTQSELPQQPPAMYAVTVLTEENDWGQQNFVMRRFLSHIGDWDKPVGFPSPFPFARPLQFKDHEVLAFAGRLWCVDLGWGALSADPFSDQPDFHFVELPKGRVTAPVEGLRNLGRYRRMGISEGRLRYVEVSQEEPLIRSSFVLDNDKISWTLEHQMSLSPLLANGVHPSQDDTLRIGVVDPLNSSVIHLTIGNIALALDMGKEEVLGCSMLGEGNGPERLCGFLKPCVLPPWLGSSKIHSAGDHLFLMFSLRCMFHT
jgi:hypothetical protein